MYQSKQIFNFNWQSHQSKPGYKLLHGGILYHNQPVLRVLRNSCSEKSLKNKRNACSETVFHWSCRVRFFLKNGCVYSKTLKLQFQDFLSRQNHLKTYVYVTCFGIFGRVNLQDTLWTDCSVFYRQRRIWNPTKHLRWSFLRK